MYATLKLLLFRRPKAWNRFVLSVSSSLWASKLDRCRRPQRKSWGRRRRPSPVTLSLGVGPSASSLNARENGRFFCKKKPISCIEEEELLYYIAVILWWNTPTALGSSFHRLVLRREEEEGTKKWNKLWRNITATFIQGGQFHLWTIKKNDDHLNFQ